MTQFCFQGIIKETRAQCIEGGKCVALVDFGNETGCGEIWVRVPKQLFEECKDGMVMDITMDIFEKPETTNVYSRQIL